jgi:hypothetical protein
MLPKNLYQKMKYDMKVSHTLLLCMVSIDISINKLTNIIVKNLNYKFDNHKHEVILKKKKKKKLEKLKYNIM